MDSREDPWPVCPRCEGDGYTETWNDDQSDVIITPCICPLGSHDVGGSWLSEGVSVLGKEQQ